MKKKASTTDLINKLIEEGDLSTTDGPDIKVSGETKEFIKELDKIRNKVAIKALDILFHKTK